MCHFKYVLVIFGTILFTSGITFLSLSVFLIIQHSWIRLTEHIPVVVPHASVLLLHGSPYWNEEAWTKPTQSLFFNNIGWFIAHSFWTLNFFSKIIQILNIIYKLNSIYISKYKIPVCIKQIVIKLLQIFVLIYPKYELHMHLYNFPRTNCHFNIGCMSIISLSAAF
jgi:hypothetical protein